MTPEIYEELVRLDLVKQGEVVEECHRTEGPAIVSACYRVPAGFIWHERHLNETISDPLAVDTLLSDDIQQLPSWIALPMAGPAGVFYSGLRGSRLLSQIMLSANPLTLEEVRWMGVWHRVLGSQLAQLHSIHSPAFVPQPRVGHWMLDEVHAIAESRKAGRESLPAERLQMVLGQQYPVLVSQLERAYLHYSQCASSAIVHGEFRPGYISVPDEPDREACGHNAYGLRVLGWLDTTLACPAIDVGWFLGELREVQIARAASGHVDAQNVTEFGHQFVIGYSIDGKGKLEKSCRSVIDAYAAAKIVSHVATYLKWFPFNEHVLRYLAIADSIAQHVPSQAARAPESDKVDD